MPAPLTAIGDKPDMCGVWRLVSDTETGILVIFDGVSPDTFVYAHRPAGSIGPQDGSDLEWGVADPSGIGFNVDPVPGQGLSALGMSTISRDGEDLVVSGSDGEVRFHRVAVEENSIAAPWFTTSEPYDFQELDVWLADGTMFSAGYGVSFNAPPLPFRTFHTSVTWGTYDFNQQTGALHVDKPGTSSNFEMYTVTAHIENRVLRLDFKDGPGGAFQAWERNVGFDRDDLVVGTAGNDVLACDRYGADTIVGGEGIDTALVPWLLSPENIHYDQSTGGYRIYKDSIVGIERVEGPERKLAFDFGPGRHAEVAARILGVVLGTDALARPGNVGLGLHLLDSGMDEATLVQAALDYRLGPGASPTAVVDLLYAHLVGHAPSPNEESHWVSLVQSGAVSLQHLAVAAVESPQAAVAIDLVGLVAKGIEYS